ncbi:hypothetical protein M6I34_14580 [Burkholderiaceae bacterium FT117]|uniref:hypothetical protein n=1 Tax=Zeimonas sediminis TaxID=2944268 RepID=UPI002342BDCD|nr:hypothetical protein [Zeimonas sediminis]MCM5571744.1 hypothetical protein [Zeimonas sediminis]
MEWLQVGATFALVAVWISAVVAVLALLSGGRRDDEEDPFASTPPGGHRALSANLQPQAGEPGE